MREAENLAEAEARALADRLGGEEGLECAFEHFGRHSAAGVGDADLHIFAGANVADLVGGELHVLGGDTHHPLTVHRVAGVYGKIDDRIFELVRVDIDRPGIEGEVDFDTDALAQSPVEQVGHAADQIPAVDALGQQAARNGRRRGGGGSARRRGSRLPSRC